MATTNYKTLGQVAPAVDTDTTLYGCPAATQAIASTLTICNRNSAVAKFRVAKRVAGAALENKHYLYYDAELAANETKQFTVGIVFAANDVLTIRANTANLSFNLDGAEIS